MPVLCFPRLLYQRSKETNGYQLILRDSIAKLLQNPENYGLLSKNISDLPEYDLMSESHQNYLGKMRTDLDAFHEIEIQSLMWAGSVRMDIAIRRYLKKIDPKKHGE